MLLALDLGGVVGFALFRSDGTFIRSGRKTVKKGAFPESYGERALDLAKWLYKFIPENGVTRVVFESPWIPRGGFQHDGDAPKVLGKKKIIFTDHSIRLGILWADTVELICAQSKVPCGEVSATSAKAEFTGNGRCEKKDMVAEAKRRGWMAADNDNEHEGDACGIGVVDLVARNILPARPKKKAPPKPKKLRPAPLIELA